MMRTKATNCICSLRLAFASIDFGEPEKPDSQFTHRILHMVRCGEADINHQSGAIGPAAQTAIHKGVRLRIPWLTSVDGT